MEHILEISLHSQQRRSHNPTFRPTQPASQGYATSAKPAPEIVTVPNQTRPIHHQEPAVVIPCKSKKLTINDRPQYHPSLISSTNHHPQKATQTCLQYHQSPRTVLHLHRTNLSTPPDHGRRRFLRTSSTLNPHHPITPSPAPSPLSLTQLTFPPSRL